MKPSTIETVDTGLVEYIEKEFNIHVFTNSGFRKVPVIWTGSERTHQIKSNPNLRDSTGKLILPIISVERTGMQKDPAFKGAIQADIRPLKGQGRDYLGGAFKVISKLNQEKTSKLQNAFNAQNQGPDNSFFNNYGRKFVVDEWLVPVPTYVAITYSLTLRSEYQQQMNQMILPFITSTGQVNHFVFKKESHRFEAFIQQDFAASNNLASMAEEERKFQTKIDIKVLGYLIGGGDNEPRPKVTRRETIASIHSPIETVLNLVKGVAPPWNPLGQRNPGGGSVVGDGDTDGTDGEDGDTGTTSAELRSTYQHVWLNGKCYLRKRAIGLTEEDSTATLWKSDGTAVSDTNMNTTTITGIIDGIRQGDETNHRLGKTKLEFSGREEEETVDVRVAKKQDDCE